MNPLFLAKLEEAVLSWHTLKMLWDNAENDTERVQLMPEIDATEKDMRLYTALLWLKNHEMNPLYN